jgi:tRNA-specific 2-thiouridylase
MRLAAEKSGALRAFYLKIWLEDELAFLGRCPWDDDLRYVREVCELAGVPLEVLSLQREYFERVVEHTLAELRAGRTPSPDVVCNRRIKLGAFLDRVGPGWRRVASGHYARTAERGGLVRLLRGVDPVKDQTYFLSQLDQAQVRRAVFPIGHLSKAEVRAEATALGLPNRDRPDSQGICFLGRIPFDDFVAIQLGERAGEIREVESGRVLGEHRGYWFHTIGQRRGLGLAGGPWYVTGKEVERNLVWVTHADRLLEHASCRLVLRDPHWIAAPPQRSRLEVRVRHTPDLVGCEVGPAPGGGLEVRLDRPDPGLAPGQYAVLYDGDECLGGGAIA